MKRFYTLLNLAIAVGLLGSCKKSSNVHPNKGIDLNLSVVQQQQAYQNNDFTFNLFRSVSATNTNGSNLFMSPLSVSIALGMTSNGANGATRDSMRTTLAFSAFTQDQVNSYYNKLITDLPQLDPNTTLKIANSIWYRQDYNVSPSFLQTGTTNYLAKIQSLDFTDAASINTINKWVSDQTNGKIPTMVDKISSDDKMILINAIYFKSIWANKFEASATTPMPFILPDNSEIETQFMNGDMPCNSYVGTDATVLELPYSNNKYSLVMVMPHSGSLNSFISSLTSDAWQAWMGKLASQTDYVSIPKFQFTYTNELKDQLSAMGMSIAFSGNADFTNINPAGNLAITSVTHKAYIAVDETGTEAAAATKVTMGNGAAYHPPVKIDHPFVFAIREMKSGLILFAGSVNNPAQSGF
jgi:serine protease inhibitor